MDTARTLRHIRTGAAVGVILAIGLVDGANAATRAVRRPKTTVAAPTTAAPTSTTPSTTIAATTLPPSTTTTPPGKEVAFFYDTPLGGAGATTNNPPVCTPDGAGCLTYTFTGGTREIGGDLIGYQVNVSAGYRQPQRNVDTSLFLFSGAVSGCNVGTFALISYSESAPLKTLPAVGEVIKTTVARWDIVADSGTKGLVGITGSGTTEAQLVSPTLLRFSFKGRISCAR